MSPVGTDRGLVGTITLSDEYRTFTISNSYATGNVICTSGSNVGGLIGNIDASNGSKGSIVITKAVCYRQRDHDRHSGR